MHTLKLTHVHAHARTHARTAGPVPSRSAHNKHDSGGVNAESRAHTHGANGFRTCAAELSARGGTAGDGRRANRVESRLWPLSQRLCESIIRRSCVRLTHGDNSATHTPKATDKHTRTCTHAYEHDSPTPARLETGIGTGTGTDKLTNAHVNTSTHIYIYI
jgi:hypothetical protein